MAAGTLGTLAGQEHWLATFAGQEHRLAAVGPDWLHAMRRQALERFAELGFPSTKVEEWRYTNLTPLARTAFDLAEPTSPPSVAAASERLLASVAAHRILVVNAHPAGTLPRFPGLDCFRLPEVLRERPDWLRAHLGRLTDSERHPLVALNTAFLDNAVVLRLAGGTVLEYPVLIVHRLVGDGRPLASYPRTLIVAEPNSQAVVVEAWLGAEGLVSFTGAVTEIFAGEGAVLDYTRLELEPLEAFHFSGLYARLGRSASLTTNAVTLGGALVRSEVKATLEGEGSSCTLNGLYVVGGRQHVDNFTTIEHAAPHATSLELYKGILDGQAQSVFHGRIVVRPEAQKTDAVQRNKNLLLSNDAVVNTKPQLEIYADDVRCTHGATVGQVDADAVFYLRSRGLAEHDARRLLTLAFAREVLEAIRPEALREPLTAWVLERLDAFERRP